MSESAKKQEACTKNRFRTVLGILLLATNMPIGVGALAGGSALAVATGSNLWIALGVAIYGFSWIMLAGGLWLSGRGLKNYFAHRNKKRNSG